MANRNVLAGGVCALGAEERQNVTHELSYVADMLGAIKFLCDQGSLSDAAATTTNGYLAIVALEACLDKARSGVDSAAIALDPTWEARNI